MAGETEEKAPGRTAPIDQPETASPPPAPSHPRPRRNLYLAIAAGIVIAMVVAAYALTGGFQNQHSGPLVIVNEGTAYLIPVGQFDGITFLVSTPSVVNGTFSNSFGIVVYQMSTTQFASFVKSDVLGGYEWTSGPIENDSVYNLDLTVSAGSWVIVFVNPNPLLTTGIGFYTDLTLAPA